MHLATLLVVALTLSSPLAASSAANTACHECPQTVWYVDATSTTNGPGTSWGTAFRSLRPAIKGAAPGDCIWVAAGVYTPTGSLDRSKSLVIDKDLQLFGGFAGNELCMSDRAGLFWSTVLSGDIGQPGVATDNSYTVVTLSGDLLFGMTRNVVLDGFRITGAFNDSSGKAEGGGINAYLGSLLLQNCFLRKNEAPLGGGLFSRGCDLSIRETGFGLNTAKDGAGLYVTGGQVRVFNARFRKNTSSRRGGGVFIEQIFPTGTSDWMNVLLEGNRADQGGAMFLKQGVTPNPPFSTLYSGRAHMVGCTVTRNFASLAGPAFAAIDHPVLVYLAGHLELENSIIWNNSGPAPQIVGIDGTNVMACIVPPTSIWGGSSNLPLDPLISPPTFRPQGGSPAINSGVTALILPDALDLDGDGDLLEPTPVDWQLRPRVQGGQVDRGASEY